MRKLSDLSTAPDSQVAPMARQGASAASVLIVDDSAPIRIALRELIIAAGFRAAGEAESGEAAVSLVQELHPEMVLVDVFMPGIGGIEAVRRIHAAAPGTLVVLISARRRHELPADISSCGASAVLEKEELSQPGLLTRLWNERSH
jgi:two-component system, NarL family, invasion response regulator UvrY